MNDKGCAIRGSKSVADEIRDLSGEIVGEINDATDRFYAKFEKVMTSERPKDPEKAMPSRDYPSYFEDLRGNLLEIKRNVNRILEGLNRSEL